MRLPGSSASGRGNRRSPTGRPPRAKRRSAWSRLSVEELEPRVLLAHTPLLPVPGHAHLPHHIAGPGHAGHRGEERLRLLHTPGLPGQTVRANFTWMARGAAYNNELGLFFVDDARGRIGRLLPGDPGYAALALSRARSRVIFASGQTAGVTRSLDLPAGRYLGFYLVQNGTTAQLRHQNPANSLAQRPVVVFSFLRANPDGRVHMRWLSGKEFAWDDGGDDQHDFDDLTARVTFGKPQGRPILGGGVGAGVVRQEAGGGGGILGGDGTATVPCTFVPGDWVAAQDGGTAGGQGTASVSACAATLREGNSFDVTLRHTFTVPAQPSLLSFALGGPAFDTTAPNAIKDAFEAALVDGTQTSLLHTFLPGRDAFFNVSEGQAAATGAGTTFDGHTVTTDLSGLAPGSTATLILRLVNNDGATNTSATVSDFQVTPGGRGTPVVATPQVAAEPSLPAVDFSQLSDVSSSFVPQYARTSFDQDTQTLHTDLAVRDSGSYSVGGPLVVAVRHLSDPSVRVVNAVGVTPDGLPYFVLTGPAGDVVRPGDVTGTRTVSFLNPGRVPFTYDLAVLARLNHPPAFTSAPNTEGIPGVPYTYQATAADPDGDPLTFALLSGPAGLAVDPATGKVTWAPQQGDLGTQAVALRVDDGRGGTAEQDYTIGVTAAPPNRPPVFTSTPVVDGNVNTAYTYQAAARDPDGDPLTFAVVSGPKGLTIDPASGLVTWTPTANQLGTDSVSLQVADGRGGTATQTYAIGVLQEKGNLPPAIVSQPVTTVPAGQDYTYPVRALDADGDPLTYSLAAGPAGMAIDPGSGLLTWPAAQRPLAPTDQWASSVLGFSSQYSPGNWSAAQALGAPDTSSYGDLATAWAPSSENGTKEYLTLGFATPVPATGVTVRETWGNGFVYQVDALDTNDVPHTVWTGTDPSQPGAPADFNVSFAQTPFRVKGVKVYVDTNHNPNTWEEIDAVQLHGLAEGDHTDSVTVRADDGRGGSDTQSYSLSVTTAQPGEIEGTKFNDLNGDGVRDVQGGGTTPAPLLDVPGTADPYLAGQSDGTTADSGDSAPAESPVLASGVTFTPGSPLMFTVLAGTANGQSSPDGGGQISHAARNGISGIDAPFGSLVGVFLGANAPDASAAPPSLNFFDTASVPGGLDYPSLSPQLGQVFFIGDGHTGKGDAQQVVVPTGATRLYLATMDGGPWHDNTGSFAVEVTPYDPTTGPSPIDLTPIATSFNSLIHVDYYEPDNTLIASVNYGGGQPHNFEEIKPNGSHVQFSNVSGFSDEVYMAIARSSDVGGFKPGDLFVGNGRDGQIARITDNGQTVLNPWVTLPGSGHGLFRGYVTFDRTGVFGGDLIAETDAGEVWRIDAAGQATEVGTTHSFLEGVEVIPNDPTRYGPLAGTILATDENSSGFYSITPAGQVTFHNIGVGGLEDAHVIPANENFFGADYGHGRVLAIAAAQIAPMVGDILFTQEFGGGLFRMYWDGNALQVQPLDLAAGSTTGSEWEGSNFAPAGVAPLPPVPVEPGLPNWTVYLDLNHNGKLDPGEPSTTTDASGHYAFTNVLPGTYTVAEVGQPGWRQTAPATGTHTVTVLPGQVASGVDFGNTQLNVPSGSRNPAFTSTAPTAATVGQLYRYDAVVSDPDGAALTFDLPAHPAGMGVDATTGVVFWDPTADEVGPQTVVLRVQDGHGGVALQSFQVTVSPAGSAPVITSVPPAQAVVAVPYQYRVRAQDAAGNPLTFTLDTAPAGMSIDGTGLVSYTPTAAQVGTQHVHLTVDNGHGGQAVQQFDLAVVATAPNDPPAVTSSPRTVVRIGSDYLYAVQASDPDGDALSYSLTTAPAGMTIDAAGVIRWTPTAAQFGPNAVSVTVTDARGLAAPPQTFTVNVISQTVNHPPAIASTPRPGATLGHTYQYDATATDPDGDPVVWSLLKAPVGMSIDPVTGAVRWAPTADELGPQEVEVQAQDPLLAAATQDFTVTVRSVDVPPAIVSEPPTTAVTGAAYTYAVQATDAENDPLTYSLPAAPAGMTIDAGGAIHWTPTAAEVGPQAVLVQVDDGQGGTATQAYQVVVTDQAGNQAPAIASAAPLAATVGGAYRCPVAAADPDGDKVSFALISAPAGMTIDTATGLVQWTPTAAELGTNLVTIAAADPAGAQGLQRFTVAVNVNQPPRITSTPPASVTAGLNYRYDVQAGDPDGDHLTYALTTGPAGMALDPSSGRLTWSPGIPDVGSHHVVVTVTDDPGATVTQSFDVNVTADTEAPKVNVAVSAGRVNVGSDVTVTVTATDNVKVAGITLTVGGTPEPLDANGTATVHLDTVGLVNVVGTATDPAGNVGTATAAVRVIDPTVTGGPTVQITGPATNTAVTALTAITGTVTDPHLESYQVQYAPFDQVDLTDLANSTANWVTFAQGTAPVTNGTLGTFDPTLLMNDAYVVRVLAQNVNGNVTAQGVVLTVSGALKLGDFTQTFTDLSIPLAGQPIQVDRIYDTKQAGQSGDFGFGWHLGFQNADVHTTVAQNVGDGLFGPVNGPFKVGTKVYLTDPAGKRVGFTFNPVPVGIPIFGTFWKPAFTPDPGVYDQLDTLTDPTNPFADLYAKAPDGSFSQPFSFFGPYSPTVFNLTTTDGTRYKYDESQGLQQITDPNGNTITFTAAGITSSQGPAIVFKRDAQGRIAEIDDPAGHALTYSYDAAGNLTSFTDQVGNRTQYQYLSDPTPYISQIADPRGNVILKLQYDPATGRAVGLVDANGNPVTSTYDTGTLTEKVRDALGNVTGLVYDPQGNVIERTDPLGNTTHYTYDASNNPIGTTDPLGRTSSRVYDDRGNVLSSTDALGSVTRFEYDANNHVLRTTDPLGHVETAVYDAAGNLVRRVEANGATQQFTYDSQGRVAQLVDEQGRTTRFTYGPSGAQPTRIVRNDGTAVSTEYDPFDEPVRSVDPNGNVTQYQYDGAGDLLAVIDANGGVTRYTYDANGNVASETDPLGQTTRYTYDARNLQLTATDPLGNVSHYGYDANGNLVEYIDRDGRRRTAVYDANNRLTEEDWWDGATMVRSIEYAYDAVGNVVSESDPDSHYAYTYDALNRVATVDNAGTPLVPHIVLTYAYDADGNVTSVVDDRGVRVDSAYGATGNLASQSWSGLPGGPGARAAFGYCDCGALTQVSRFADAAGTQLVGQTDYTYDAAGDLSGLTHQDATGGVLADYTFAYDASSSLTSATVHGRHFDFQYDSTGQLVQVNRDGVNLEAFHYDANGNRTGGALQTGSGNQLTSDGTFAYTYDAEGNLVSQRDLATADVTDYTYDFRNRMTSAVRRSAGGVLLSEVHYVYDVRGRRIVKEVVGGPTVATVYDGLNPWVDYDSGGAVLARYLPGPTANNLLARFRPGEGVVWYLADNVGTVRDLADASGKLIDQIEYSAYGVPLSQTNPAAGDRFLFTGQEYDPETGLYYDRARYYDPRSGRFISQDPLGFSAGDTNLYRYVGNRPLSAVDPLGLTEEETEGLNTSLAPVRQRLIEWGKCIYDTYASIPSDSLGPVGFGNLSSAQFAYFWRVFRWTVLLPVQVLVCKLRKPPGPPQPPWRPGQPGTLPPQPATTLPIGNYPPRISFPNPNPLPPPIPPRNPFPLPLPGIGAPPV